MTHRFRVLAVVTVATLTLGLAALAQTPPSGAALAGIVEGVTGNTLTLQGLTLNVVERSKFVTVGPDGAMGPIPFAEVQAGVPIHARFIFVEGAPTLVLGELGNDFFWHGVVTALGDGTLTLDGAVTIHIGQARLVGPGALQVGATVGVKGEVLNGIFAARVINTQGLDFGYRGTISALAVDEGGVVTGFIFGRGETSYAVALDMHSVIWKGRLQLSPNDLVVGMKVDVSGWVQPDGSVLAWSVRILK